MHEIHERAYTDGMGLGVVFFQEHEYARIDTNVYVMGALEPRKARNGWEYLLLNLMIKVVIFCVFCVFRG